MKPILIRTTDPAMQQALHLVCPRHHPHHPVVGGVIEASSSPGLPTAWFEGLKGPGILKGPLEPPLGEALQRVCVEYLDFVGNNPYSKENFKKGAELGTKLLDAAGGREEANPGIQRTWVERQEDHFEGLRSNFFEGLFGKPS